MADSKNSKNRCSFCGRTEKEVGLLISGLNGFICDNCARQAYEITKEALDAKRKAQGIGFEMDDLPKPKEIKAFLDQYVIGQDDATQASPLPHDMRVPLISQPFSAE